MYCLRVYKIILTYTNNFFFQQQVLQHLGLVLVHSNLQPPQGLRSDLVGTLDNLLHNRLDLDLDKPKPRKPQDLDSDKLHNQQDLASVKLSLHTRLALASAHQHLVDLVVDLDKPKPHKPQDLDSDRLHNQRDLALVRQHNQPVVVLDLDKRHKRHSQQDLD